MFQGKILKKRGEFAEVLLLCRDCGNTYKKEYHIYFFKFNKNWSTQKLFCEECARKRQKLRSEIAKLESCEKRERALRAECYFCGGKNGLLLHYKSYTPHDFVAMCGACHRKLHKLVKTPELEVKNDQSQKTCQ